MDEDVGIAEPTRADGYVRPSVHARGEPAQLVEWRRKVDVTHECEVALGGKHARSDGGSLAFVGAVETNEAELISKAAEVAEDVGSPA